jgi:hypothetical protein
MRGWRDRNNPITSSKACRSRRRSGSSRTSALPRAGTPRVHYARCSTARKRPEQLAATVKALGRGMGSPWGADQKYAALLAWLLLAGGA